MKDEIDKRQNEADRRKVAEKIRTGEVDNKIEIDGKEYYTLDTFAIITERSEQALRLAIRLGNRERKLKAISVRRTLFVLASELVDYTFYHPGRSSLADKFDEKGVKRTGYVY